jgi:hypothetical protein
MASTLANSLAAFGGWKYCPALRLIQAKFAKAKFFMWHDHHALCC